MFILREEEVRKMVDAAIAKVLVNLPELDDETCIHWRANPVERQVRETDGDGFIETIVELVMEVMRDEEEEVRKLVALVLKQNKTFSRLLERVDDRLEVSRRYAKSGGNAFETTLAAGVDQAIASTRDPLQWDGRDVFRELAVAVAEDIAAKRVRCGQKLRSRDHMTTPFRQYFGATPSPEQTIQRSHPRTDCLTLASMPSLRSRLALTPPVSPSRPHLPEARSPSPRNWGTSVSSQRPSQEDKGPARRRGFRSPGEHRQERPQSAAQYSPTPGSSRRPISGVEHRTRDARRSASPERHGSSTRQRTPQQPRERQLRGRSSSPETHFRWPEGDSGFAGSRDGHWTLDKPFSMA
ncbi:hypothetical protein C8R46DRAFT_179731 [Mycena filopes]|nr:hypothetical protein C8R46DRAFT_179731 [Mycena filopes]